ncbi:MAG: hypothetical protein LBM77_11785 [Spirochaetaceae bacterium]|jgi:hypothetical protein|nr:hypothetical protein [Spirochaetaceae bacterium]
MAKLQALKKCIVCILLFYSVVSAAFAEGFELYIKGVQSFITIETAQVTIDYNPPSYPCDFILGMADLGLKLNEGAGINIIADPFPESNETVAIPARKWTDPLPSDPGLILTYPQAAWRDTRFELFYWQAFPDILIIDTASYDVLKGLFHRLAFFVEKRDYRGTIPAVAAVWDKHGWNAHDYNAADLGNFFEKARVENIQLTALEESLKEILLANGIIVQAKNQSTGKIQAGKGAVLGISQESGERLRQQFMVHEGYHGIYFVDADFQKFAAQRWQALEPAAKRFLKSYLAWSGYDSTDESLMINEFMAYNLERPPEAVGWYLGDTAPRRIMNSWRKQDLPEQAPVKGTSDGMGWPGLITSFTREAEAFSEYVHTRWHLYGGTISFVTKKVM